MEPHGRQSVFRNRLVPERKETRNDTWQRCLKPRIYFFPFDSLNNLLNVLILTLKRRWPSNSKIPHHRLCGDVVTRWKPLFHTQSLSGRCDDNVCDNISSNKELKRWLFPWLNSISCDSWRNRFFLRARCCQSPTLLCLLSAKIHFFRDIKSKAIKKKTANRLLILHWRLSLRWKNLVLWNSLISTSECEELGSKREEISISLMTFSSRSWVSFKCKIIRRRKLVTMFRALELLRNFAFLWAFDDLI